MFRMDRYILTEMSLPFGLTIGTFLMVLMMQQGLRFVDWIVNRGLSPGTVFELFLSLMPMMMLFAMPIAVLVATTTAFNRLSADRELIALWTLGLSPARLLRPAILFGGGAALLSTLLLHAGQPIDGQSLRVVALSLLNKEQAMVSIDEGRFQKLDNDLIFYVDRSPHPTQLEGVFLFDYRRPTTPQFVVARFGRVHTLPAAELIELTLTEGSLHRQPSLQGSYQRIFFDSYTLRFDLSGLVGTPSVEAPSIESIRIRLRSGEQVEPKLLSRLTSYEAYRALPSACLIFGILGLPLGIISRRGGRFGGFAVGLGVMACYYLLLTIANTMARTERLSPLFAAWVPNGIVLLFTVLLLAWLFVPMTRRPLIRPATPLSPT